MKTSEIDSPIIFVSVSFVQGKNKVLGVYFSARSEAEVVYTMKKSWVVFMLGSTRKNCQMSPVPLC